MRRQIISAITAMGLTFSFCAIPVQAAGETTRVQTIQALGIMAGDESGALHLEQSVTRAQFVTMMTAASSFRDTVGAQNGSALFRDVKSNHWASGYIGLAVEQGWMSGYVDGTFRPEQTITLEEACTALLRLLGYDSGSLSGAYPTAQLAKSAAVGLLDDVSAKQGDTLTRQDCVDLFYALFLSDTASNTLYADTQGYKVKDDELDYATLVTDKMQGPYVTESGTLSLPFDSVTTVYRNGLVSSLSEVGAYDVYYYNEAMQTVWVYSERVSGTLSAVTPNRTAPTSATVAGKTYELGTASASYALSSLGGFADGSVVTLLLGMNGEVVDVVSASQAETVYCGVVVSSTKGASDSTTSTGATSIQVTTQVACTDGVVRTFYHTGSVRRTGAAVSVTVNKNGTTMNGLNKKSLSGLVNRSATKLGDTPFAEDIEILDFDDEGGYVRIYPERLAGETFRSDDVYYYRLNAQGEIDRLVLKEVTGDTWEYVYITSAENEVSGTSVSGRYTYLQNGTERTVSGDKAYSIKTGGAMIREDGNEIKSMRQLGSVVLTDINTMNATGQDGKVYPLSQSVQVLLREGGNYYLTTAENIHAEDYSMVGWYDNLGCSAGGQIRILIATKKSS